jgi:hypothetical protein
VTATLSVSTNGSSLSTSSTGPPLAATLTEWFLGLNSLGAHIQFFGLYPAAQVPNLITASTTTPPIPTGSGNIYADFVAGVYYLNGVLSTRGTIFGATPYDGSVSFVNPPDIIVDGEGLEITNYTGMPGSTGSSAILTPAALSAAQALADAGAMAGIVKYTIDSASEGYGAYVTQMNATGGSFVIEDMGDTSDNVATVVANGGDFASPQPSTSDATVLTQMAWLMLFAGSAPPASMSQAHVYGVDPL